MTCTIPPKGWYCTRVAGHDGPCAAHAVPKAPSEVSGKLRPATTPKASEVSGSREAIEAAGLEVADLIERHMKSSAMIWSLGKGLPDDWMTELRSITVAALESEILKLLALSTPPAASEVVERLRSALDGFVDALTSSGNNSPTMLSINHDVLRACLDEAQAALSSIDGEGA